MPAHSGGGSFLMAILRHLDPDEVHTFDALYSDPGPLITWAGRRKAAGTGALRVRASRAIRADQVIASSNLSGNRGASDRRGP